MTMVSDKKKNKKNKSNFDDTGKLLKTDFNDTIKILKKDISNLNKDMRVKLNKIDSFVVEIRKAFKENNKIMLEMTKVNKNVDETLGNVFLAIRQNEYLQAWYPAQHGFPELKVTGTHPAKLK